MLYERQDADFLPVHIPALFVILKLLGFWSHPTSLGSVGCRNHGARCCESHTDSQSMESGLDLLGLFRHLIKHIPSHSPCVSQGEVQCLEQCQGWAHPRTGTGEGEDWMCTEAPLHIGEVLKHLQGGDKGLRCHRMVQGCWSCTNTNQAGENAAKCSRSGCRVGRFSPSTSLAHPCSLRGDRGPVTEGTLHVWQNCSLRNTPVLKDKAQTTSKQEAW